jgi:hypothetical protein
MLTQDGIEFLTKLDPCQKLYHAIPNAFQLGVLHLNDQRRACVLLSGKNLEDFENMTTFEVKGQKTMKKQWLHSAALIYMYLKLPLHIPSDSGCILLLENVAICLEMAKNVLQSDPIGTDFVHTIDIVCLINAS